MKQLIRSIVVDAVLNAHKNGTLCSDQIPEMEIGVPRHPDHGDFSANIAMVSAKIQKMPPRKIAESIVSQIRLPQTIEKVEIAGPGFINFFLSGSAWHPVVDQVLSEDEQYGSSDLGENQRVQVEFVSANPTGPLHVGHGRGAAVGDAVAAILSFAGYDVQREYYINDSGRQIRTLGTSVWLRVCEKSGADIDFPEDCYQGDYINDLADQVIEIHGDQFHRSDETDAVMTCATFAARQILSGIKEDLENFGVVFDCWFSEQSLYDSDRVQSAIDHFKSKDIVYEKDGALWFRTEKYGDEKDRVVVRNNGLTTYFASDIAYHKEKFERGFSRVIDVWGADHHGYIKRIEAAIEAAGEAAGQSTDAAGYGKDQFDVILVRLVNLLRDGKPFQMSTRAGEFVTLKDIVDEVGKDAARFMFLSRSYDSGLDFDLELAKQKNADNPVYYVQYVHARITGILLKAVDQGLIREIDFTAGRHLSHLTAPEEIQLLKILGSFRENVEKSAKTLHPHVIFTFLMSLASAFHGYYNKHKVITDDGDLTLARLSLVLSVKKVIRNGLTLLGVSAPERM